MPVRPISQESSRMTRVSPCEDEVHAEDGDGGDYDGKDHNEGDYESDDNNVG